MAKGRKCCEGCRDNYYNGKNEHGIKECWSLKNAKVVKRWRLSWWTRPETKEAFTKVTTHHCHSAPGQYALYERLPRHLGGGLA